MSFTKESEIRPRDIFLKLLDCCREDAADLLANGAFEPVDCPACGGAAVSDSYAKSGFQIVTCASCGTLYNSPRPTRACLDAFYPTSRSSRFFVEEFYPRVEAARKAKLLPERAERLAQFMAQQERRQGVVVDVGAGQGFFLEVLRDRMPAFEYRAIEPNPSFAEICAAKGFRTAAAFAEHADAWAGEADLVVCFEVFEHVHNPRLFVRKLRDLLKPGGSLLITSLSGDGFDIKVLREQADIVAPPQHLNYLSIEGYRRLFAVAGFETIDITTPGRLDVNIVETKERENPGIVTDAFARTLLAQSEETRAAFQRFLAAHQLSSHVWIFATMPS